MFKVDPATEINRYSKHYIYIYIYIIIVYYFKKKENTIHPFWELNKNSFLS